MSLKGVGELVLALVPTTPSKLVLKLSWDSERLTSFIFTVLQGNKSAGMKFDK